MKRGEIVKKALFDDLCERRAAEDIWLNYFNRYLFETGSWIYNGDNRNNEVKNLCSVYISENIIFNCINKNNGVFYGIIVNAFGFVVDKITSVIL